jgi:cell shape-determining protein MreC
MKAKKANRVISIDEADKEFYKSEGYDIVELDELRKTYKVIETATSGKTYTVSQYNLLLEENKKLRQENKELKNTALVDREELKQKLTDLKVSFAPNAPTAKLIELVKKAEKK